MKMKLMDWSGMSRGGCFTAKVGHEEHYDVITISRRRAFGKELQKPGVSWFSGSGSSNDIEGLRAFNAALGAALLVIEGIVHSEALGREADVPSLLRMTGLDQDGLTVVTEGETGWS